jgi:sigma-E factor negative regulatory protein RseC
MSNIKVIEHKGFVKKITGNSMIVGILASTGCSTCQAKSTCNVSDTPEKDIEIDNFDNSYEIGEQVNVFYNESLEFRAIFIAYIMPFILVIAVLILLNSLTSSELITGLSAIGILVPYFLLLSVFKNKIRKTFSFTVGKIQASLE